MALQLQGQTGRPPLLEVLLAVVAVLGLCGLGCGTPGVRARRVPASVFLGQRAAAHHPSKTRPGHEGAAFVAAALRRSGLRFGTDGTTGALWGYLSGSHQLIPSADARPGDVLFFDTRAGAAPPSCANHAAIVDRVEPDGRIVFADVRGKKLRKSVVDPGQPGVRRNQAGEVANSFLRVKAIDDPADARYLAGELLCGVVRVTPTK
jgi:hypothetical protein